MVSIIPNLLTTSRFFIGLLCVALFSVGGTTPLYVAFCLLILNEVTDLADGFLARRLGAVTRLGGMLDSAADYFSHGAASICFLSIGLAPLWLVTSVVFVDILTAFMRILTQARAGSYPPVRWPGKIKTAVQGSFLVFVLYGWGLDMVDAGSPPWTLGAVLLTFTLYGLVDFAVAYCWIGSPVPNDPIRSLITIIARGDFDLGRIRETIAVFVSELASPPFEPVLPSKQKHE